MSILVIAEHENGALKGATLNTVAAAQQVGGDIDLLVAGSGCAAVADEASKVSGVAKVLLADADCYGHQLAENMAQLVVELAPNYSHILSAATTNGKNFMPRVAALLDVAQISDIIGSGECADTFKRPIYAGNAIATVQSADSVKVITVRSYRLRSGCNMTGSAAVETRRYGARCRCVLISLRKSWPNLIVRN